MTSRLDPYVMFLGDAAAALEFYAGVFDGEATFTRYCDAGLDDIADADKIMHGQVVAPGGFTLMCADTPAGAPHEAGTNVRVCLHGRDPDDRHDLHRWFDRLAVGAQVDLALELRPWGREFGQLTDKFGTVWMVDIAPPDIAPPDEAPDADAPDAGRID